MIASRPPGDSHRRDSTPGRANVYVHYFHMVTIQEGLCSPWLVEVDTKWLAQRIRIDLDSGTVWTSRNHWAFSPN